jgi:hypothetical protein
MIVIVDPDLEPEPPVSTSSPIYPLLISLGSHSTLFSHCFRRSAHIAEFDEHSDYWIVPVKRCMKQDARDRGE